LRWMGAPGCRMDALLSLGLAGLLSSRLRAKPLASDPANSGSEAILSNTIRKTLMMSTELNRGTRLYRSTLAVLALLAASTAIAADWPQWRGPNRDATSEETGLLDEWPEDGPKLAWTAKGIGEGYAALSIVGGRIYTMGEDKKSSYIHALDEATGKIVWSAPVGNVGGGAGYPGPRATPTVDGDQIYSLGQFGDLVCVSKDGKEVWRKNLEKDFKGKMMSGWGYSESVLIDGDKLICTPGGPDGTIVALKKTTGEVVWRSKDFTDSAAYSSIVSADISGKRTYIQLTGDSVVGINAADGAVLWKAPRKGEIAVIPTPVYWNNHVFVTSGYNIGGDLFKITPPEGDGQFKVDLVYHTDDMEVHVGGVVLVDGHLYGVSDNFLTCIDLLTGKRKWKDRSIGKGAVVYADKHLYVRADATPGEIALVEANPKKYEEKSIFEQPDGSGRNTWAPPVIVNGKMYLRDQDVLLCYDIKAK
jgi:outer membrane protein assembly factor BamB